MAVLNILLAASLIAAVYGHLLMRSPPQRGIYSACQFDPTYDPIEPGLPLDWKAHFPSGDKGDKPGSGLQSQIAAAGIWEPYEPRKKPNLRYRAGVCGDQVDTSDTPVGDHLRDGKFYVAANDIDRIPTYEQGGVISLDIQVIAHHNGYVEAILCDVASSPCNGEISAKCLKSPACRKLRRAPSACDTDQLDSCAPIDPNNPTRWHMPCSRIENEIYNKIYFKLPNDVHCNHCVLQTYSVSANSCNPPEIYQYFRGPEGPRWWGNCTGQGGARGGYRYWGKCGGTTFPEEYYMCSDIKITERSVGAEPIYPSNDKPNPISSIKVSTRAKGTSEAFSPIGYVQHEKELWWTFRARNLEVQLEAVLTTEVKSVHFWVEDAHDLYSTTTSPFTFPGPGFWDGTHEAMKMNGWFTVQVTAKTLDGFNHYTEIRLFFER